MSSPPELEFRPPPKRHSVMAVSIYMYSVYIYWPKQSFGQGNIFRSVCHSVHRGGGVVWSGPGGVSPIFQGGVPPNFRGGSGPGGVSPIFQGGSYKFSGGGGVSNFWGGCLHRNTVNVWLVCILLECILVTFYLYLREYGVTMGSSQQGSFLQDNRNKRALL